MVKTIDITDLMQMAEINHQGTIQLTDNMSGLEADPREDWLYYALKSFKSMPSERTESIRSAAFIGSGNGIEAIAALNVFPNLRNVTVTDILPEIIPSIQKNIDSNIQGKSGVNIRYAAGRDCAPLEGEVDFIYGNLPLIAVSASNIGQNLSTTTLTDASAYAYLSQGQSDALRKYTLLSQLGFLLSAKKKIRQSGVVVTLIGGRVPNEVIQECFARAGLEHRLLLTGFKTQSDPQFLREYAGYELEEQKKDDSFNFVFYDNRAAAELLKDIGIQSSGIITGYSHIQLNQILKPAQISANQAFGLFRERRIVSHLAYAFAAYNTRSGTNEISR